MLVTTMKNKRFVYLHHHQGSPPQGSKLSLTRDIPSCFPEIFKPGTPGFLELLLSVNVCMFACVCVCVCVSTPEAINN